MSEAVEATGFDTSLPGMSQTQWSNWANQAAAWVPPAGHIVVVAPHPDDETLGAGGLIFTYARSHTKVTVISVTDGELACAEVPELAAVRRCELVSAMRELEVAQTDIVRLGLPDGAVASHEIELANWLARCIPDGAIMVAPFEFDGHPDHDTAGRACRAAAGVRGFALVRYPIWGWYRGARELFMERRGVRYLLDRPARQAKLRALAQFRSQLDDRPGGAIVPAHVLEYFQRPYEMFLL